MGALCGPRIHEFEVEEPEVLEISSRKSSGDAHRARGDQGVNRGQVATAPLNVRPKTPRERRGLRVDRHDPRSEARAQRSDTFLSTLLCESPPAARLRQRTAHETPRRSDKAVPVPLQSARPWVRDGPHQFGQHVRIKEPAGLIHSGKSSSVQSSNGPARVSLRGGSSMSPTPARFSTSRRPR